MIFPVRFKQCFKQSILFKISNDEKLITILSSITIEREREFSYYSDKYINIYNILNIKHFVPSPIGLICHFKAITFYNFLHCQVI